MKPDDDERVIDRAVSDQRRDSVGMVANGIAQIARALFVQKFARWNEEQNQQRQQR